MYTNSTSNSKQKWHYSILFYFFNLKCIPHLSFPNVPSFSVIGCNNITLDRTDFHSRSPPPATSRIREMNEEEGKARKKERWETLANKWKKKMQFQFPEGFSFVVQLKEWKKKKIEKFHIKCISLGEFGICHDYLLQVLKYFLNQNIVKTIDYANNLYLWQKMTLLTDCPDQKYYFCLLTRLCHKYLKGSDRFVLPLSSHWHIQFRILFWLINFGYHYC